MATYSTRISGAVSQTGTRTTTGTTTVYTAPADGCAIVQVGITTNILPNNAVVSIFIGGRIAYQYTLTSGTQYFLPNGTSGSPLQFYVGPGQNLALDVTLTSTTSSVTLVVSGVEYSN